LKQKYIAYSYELFRRRRKAITAEEADKIRNQTMRRLSVFNKIIEMATKQGISKEDFLSNKYGNTNSQAPEAYYVKIMEQMKKECEPLFKELVMQVHPDKAPNNKFTKVYRQMFEAVVKARDEGNLGELMRLRDKIAIFMHEYGGRRALGSGELTTEQPTSAANDLQKKCKLLYNNLISKMNAYPLQVDRAGAFREAIVNARNNADLNKLKRLSKQMDKFIERDYYDH